MLRNMWRRVKDYQQKHILFSFVFTISIAVLFVIIIMQNYSKQEYLEHLKDKTYETENSLLSAINQNIEHLLFNYIQVASEIAVDEELELRIHAYDHSENTNEVTNYQTIYERVRVLSSYSQWIEDIAIVSENGLVYDFDRLNYTGMNLWSEENNEELIRSYNKIKKIIENNEVQKYFIDNQPTSHPAQETLKLFHLYLPLKGSKDFDDVSYMLIISYNASVLSESLNLAKMNSNNIAEGYITNEKNKIVFHSDEQLMEESGDIYDDDQYITLSTPIKYFDWILNISINQNRLLKEVNIIYKKSFIFYGLLIIIILVFLISLIRWVQRPVNEIRKSIENVKKGNMKSHIEIEGKHEIWQLAEEFNRMIASVNRMNKQVETYHNETIQSLKKQRRAEVDALESQINAHFIFNTLACINYDAMEAGHQKISMQIKTLSNILRYTLYQNQNVLLFQDIAWVEQYLYLQKSRLEDVFTYSVQQDEDSMNWPCPKLMLQPFVENSIIHGFEGFEANGRIEVKAFVSEEYVHIIVKDNGRGMTPKVKSEIEKAIHTPIQLKDNERGIGISNVITRMYMFYGDDISIILNTKIGEGTKFEFILPKRVGREAEDENYDR